MVWSLCRYRL